MRKPDSWSGLDAVLFEVASTYRRQLWADQHCYIGVWSEKEAIAGVLHEITAEWDVPLMVTRGFASETFLYAAAKKIKSVQKPTYIYHFGDLDPSGVSAANAIERRLREFAPDAEIHFERAAVIESQVREFSLPTRPTKETDTRAKSWQGGLVEVDGIPSRILRSLVNNRIARNVDGKCISLH
jgi:hypothetical protein